MGVALKGWGDEWDMEYVEWMVGRETNTRSSHERETDIPITLPTTFLLDLLGVNVNVPGFGKVAGQMLLCGGGAIRETGVVSVIILVRSGH